MSSWDVGMESLSLEQKSSKAFRCRIRFLLRASRYDLQKKRMFAMRCRASKQKIKYLDKQ
jgi:hypothetical protein